MIKRNLKFFILCILLGSMIFVDAEVKCSSGKPGEVVSCVVTKSAEYSGTTDSITADTGLAFDGCDVCNGSNYTIAANGSATFKFKVDASIKENKTLNLVVAREDASVKVVVEDEDEEDTSDEVTYTVTLVPGNGNNITKSCKVNSLNSTCDVTLDELSDEKFTGWGKEKNCTSGAKGNIKVNKDITYYACYENENDSEESEDQTSSNANLLLKTLSVKNGDEEVDLGFSIRIKEYNIVIPTSVNSLIVDAVAQDENVKVTVSGHDTLEALENKITILLTDNDGKTNEYVINVKKADEVKLPLLSSLIVGGYVIDFKPETFVYTINLDQGIKELNIEATGENEAYEVDVVGNSDLKNGSKVNIIVKDLENNTESTYVINIEQELSNLIIYIGIGAGLLVILIILLVIVVKKGKKNNNKSSGNQTSQDKKKNQKDIKGKPVNNNVNIPEVKATIPVAPTTEVQSTSSSNNDKDEEIEVLDL